MTTKNQKHIEYDIRGQICPSTLLTTLKEINRLREQLSSGAICIEVKTDNRDATSTIPTTVNNMGYEATVTKKKGYYQIIINRR
jgi:TusA-related sulfurtransferase